MKKFILGLSFCMLFLANATAQDALSQKGKAFFDRKGCALCHKSDMDTIGPSLRTISIAYSGKETQLINYLRGQGSPIVDPARAAVMNPQLVKIRTLFEEDLHSISSYILESNR